MTAQMPLSVIPHPDAILIGTAAALVEDKTGGRVFLHGELALAWDVDDQECRRFGPGPAALVAARSGSKGPSWLTAAVVTDISGRRAAGASLRAIAAPVGVSTASVRQALPPVAQKAATHDEVVEPHALRDEWPIAKNPPEVVNGFIAAPTPPRLGLELDMDVVNQIRTT